MSEKGTVKRFSVGEKPVVHVDDIAYRGIGIGRVGGMVIQIDGGVMKGETVRVYVTMVKKKFLRAKAVEWVETSPDRIKPACPLAAVCAGCSYQHVDKKTELAYKKAQLTRFLPEHTPIEVDDSDDQLYSGYRNKAVFHLDTKNRKSGYVGYDNRKVVDVPACPLLHPEINAVWGNIRRMRLSTKERSATLRYTEADNVVWWYDKEPPPRILTVDSAIGPMQVAVDSFAQVNTVVAKRMQTYVRDLLKAESFEYTYDMYCGAGIFGLLAAEAGIEHVAGVDSDVHAIQIASKNAEERGYSIQFVRADAAQYVQQQRMPEQVNQVWIVDPPRKGLQEEVLDTIGDRHPRCVVYISCAPDMLGRDTELLLKQGYRLEHARLFNMFPRTSAFETVALFRYQ
ncbi:MAG: class I SAM-dependent RNA methyltransferase [Spartobacteria bacterium]|nr:class I SAM-dependent RNA methyltransferase [Spartobacteria bacterium]